MNVEGFRRTAYADRVLAGAAIGAVGGVLAVPFGLPGLAMFGVVALVSALVPPRFTFLGGLLTSAGALWVFFTTQAVVRCAANPSSCSGPSPLPFAAASAIVLAVGLLLLVVSRRSLPSVK